MGSLMEITSSRILIWKLVLAAVLVESKYDENKIAEAMEITRNTVEAIMALWVDCCLTSMPSKTFLHDHLQGFMNYPARTTVGVHHIYTSNRKFLGNLLGSSQFKDMLRRDENELRLGLLAKLRYCDEAILDQEILKDFYDREVDQTKLRRK